MAVTLEQRIMALERSVREIAETVAGLARDRASVAKMTAVAGRHPGEPVDDDPIEP